MAALGLPEPSDYSAPVNGPHGGAYIPGLPPEAPTDPTVGPFPAQPPVIVGELITENVFQKGAG